MKTIHVLQLFIYIYSCAYSQYHTIYSSRCIWSIWVVFSDKVFHQIGELSGSDRSHMKSIDYNIVDEQILYSKHGLYLYLYILKMFNCKLKAIFSALVLKMSTSLWKTLLHQKLKGVNRFLGKNICLLDINLNSAKTLLLQVYIFIHYTLLFIYIK